MTDYGLMLINLPLALADVRKNKSKGTFVRRVRELKQFKLRFLLHQRLGQAR